MEKNPENPLDELKGLKQQYKSFSQTLEGQKIIGDTEVKYTIKHCRNFFHSHCRTMLIDYPISIAIVLVAISLYHVSAIFSVCAAMHLLVGLFTELWIVRDLNRQCQDDTLMKFTQHLFEAKQFLLIYYIALSCSLLITATMATSMADLPGSNLHLQYFLLTTVGIELLYLFLAHYLPLLNQCNEALASIASDNGYKKRSTRWIKFIGLIVLSFVAITAIFKLSHLPGGTLFMLISAIMIIAYSVALTAWLHRHRALPIPLGLLMIWAISIMTYLLMARINCWPPMQHLDKIHVASQSRKTGATTAEGRFSINQIYDTKSVESVEATSDLLQALSLMDVDLLEAGDHAILAVSESDTARVNTLILGTNAPFGADSQLLWAWSEPSAEGHYQLYLLYKEPVLGNLEQKPMIEHALVEYQDQTPIFLDIHLTPEAEMQWQSNLLKLDNQPNPVALAAVLDGKVLCKGIFDHKKIGYQSIRFSLAPNAVVSQQLLQELINN